jgi:hypothetical protein
MVGLVDAEGNGSTNILRSLVTRPVLDNAMRKGITIEVTVVGMVVMVVCTMAGMVVTVVGTVVDMVVTMVGMVGKVVANVVGDVVVVVVVGHV